MINIASWLEIFSGRLEANFPGRIWFMGLQGSYARGEAKDSSDIDIVVIFDTLTMNDLLKYRAMPDDLPYHACVHNFLHERDSQILSRILTPQNADFDDSSRELFEWSGRIINNEA